MGDQLQVYDPKITSQLGEAPNVMCKLGRDHSMTLMSGTCSIPHSSCSMEILVSTNYKFMTGK